VVRLCRNHQADQKTSPSPQASRSTPGQDGTRATGISQARIVARTAAPKAQTGGRSGNRFTTPAPGRPITPPLLTRVIPDSPLLAENPEPWCPERTNRRVPQPSTEGIRAGETITRLRPGQRPSASSRVSARTLPSGSGEPPLPVSGPQGGKPF